MPRYGASEGEKVFRLVTPGTNAFSCVFNHFLVTHIMASRLQQKTFGYSCKAHDVCCNNSVQHA